MFLSVRRIPLLLQNRKINAASQILAMEKPYVLASKPGGRDGIFEEFAAIIEKHFTIVCNEEFVKSNKQFADKIEAVFVWSSLPNTDRGLLQSLPNLKVVVNGGVGVDHLDIPLISSFGVKVANTPNVVDNATADLGMTLLLASARRLVDGLVVDQDALVEALQKGVIHTAALDVTYPEPLPRDHPLLKLQNVLILPHIGTSTYQTTQKMVERMVTNALAALSGSPVPDEVKP
ncbi:UNVERIFIED_CONTAM: hypothetical protein FKN15_029965 [Acipenser sinensis]